MTIPSGDDSLMSRFDRQGLRRFTARDAVLAVTAVAFLLLIAEGASIRRAGEQMNPGVGRDMVLAIGRPAGWLSDRLPISRALDDATAWLSPDPESVSVGSFATAAAPSSEVPVVTADSFDPRQLGAKPPAKRPLTRLLITGDSMSTPLDTRLARLLASSDAEVVREPHLGSGLSKSFLVDWGELSTRQVKRLRPEALVVFIGANEGFPLSGANGRKVECCGPHWAAAYANRVRAMMHTYRQGGNARVYWVTLPTPKSPQRAAISRTVNAAIRVAAEPWRTDVRVIDTVPIFTPSGFRAAMDVDGTQTIVRASDGIHLNEKGAELLAATVLDRLAQDFEY